MGVVAILFLLIRHQAGVPIQMPGRFGLSARSVPRNVTLILGGLFSPFGSLEWMDRVRAYPPQVWGLIAMAASAALFAALVGIGCRFSHRSDPESRGRLRMIAGAMLLCCFPVSLLARVSELYVHTCLLWFALLVGRSVDGWLSTARGRGRTWLVGIAAAGYLLLLTFGLRTNLAEMRATGERARRWLDRFEEKLAPLPVGSRVVIRDHDPRRNAGDYHLYRLTSVRQLVLVGDPPWALLCVTDSRLPLRQELPPFTARPDLLFSDPVPKPGLHLLDVRGGKLGLHRWQPP